MSVSGLWLYWLFLTGGIATSDWLERNFADYLGELWSDGRTPEKDITQAFLQVLVHYSQASQSHEEETYLIASPLAYCLTTYIYKCRLTKLC